MAKNTFIIHNDTSINSQVKTSEFSSDSKAMKKKRLIKQLIKGEKSGFVKDFDKDSFLDKLHVNHSKE
ncbi:MAG: type II toxin-antitoxin system ParD family antitoxin [Fluviicola sp.]|nr:type II toxin-antitoxin system ParD family antitoxin [Fluviicola sp.]